MLKLVLSYWLTPKRFRRRYSDQLRLLADKAHERGEKDLSDKLHQAARTIEKERNDAAIR